MRRTSCSSEENWAGVVTSLVRKYTKKGELMATFALEDLQSANGTYVNNTRVDKVKLKVGDVVRFGADPACTYVLRDH